MSQHEDPIGLDQNNLPGHHGPVFCAHRKTWSLPEWISISKQINPIVPYGTKNVKSFILALQTALTTTLKPKQKKDMVPLQQYSVTHGRFNILMRP